VREGLTDGPFGLEAAPFVSLSFSVGVVSRAGTVKMIRTGGLASHQDGRRSECQGRESRATTNG
jgi:hypothetical protein